MDMENYETTRTPPLATPVLTAERVGAFLRSVYGWMCAGLAITALVAVFVASSPSLVQAIATNRLVFWGLVIAQLGIVFVLSARVHRLAPATASLLFIAYSALTGVTISFVLLAFTGESVATTFLVCAGMFGAMALYGTFTSRSLAGLGQFLFMGLIGVVLASIVGMFWHNDSTLEGDGAGDAYGPSWLVRGRRCVVAIPRLHQSVPVPIAVSGRPPGVGVAIRALGGWRSEMHNAKCLMQNVE
jgi:FtsH-binding integral membrane protein